MAYDITLVRGDGVGPELAEAARRCVDATGVAVRWDVQEAGVDIMETAGTPLPPSLLDSAEAEGNPVDVFVDVTNLRRLIFGY